MARLVVVEGRLGRDSYPLGGKCVIGRGAGCEVRLEDGSASTRHAEVARRGDGFQVRDLRSSNGTRVNGERVTSWRPLVDGDRISVGQAVLRFDGRGRYGGRKEPAGGRSVAGERGDELARMGYVNPDEERRRKSVRWKAGIVIAVVAAVIKLIAELLVETT